MAAAVALMVGGAVVNALAFSGSYYIFHSFEGGTEERSRHDKAIESLQTATKDLEQKRVKTLDYLNKELQKQKLAESDFADVDAAMELYKEYHPEKHIVLAAKPIMNQFYVPNKTQQYGEYVVIASGMALTSVMVFKFL